MGCNSVKKGVGGVKKKGWYGCGGRWVYSVKTVSRREKPFFFASIFGGSPLLLQQVFATPPPRYLQAGRPEGSVCVSRALL